MHFHSSSISSSSNWLVVGWDEASAALKSGKRAALRIFEKSRLWIAKNFSINFAYTYGSFVYHKVCEEDRGSLNTLCKTLFWQASHCLLLPSSLEGNCCYCLCNTFQLSKKLWPYLSFTKISNADTIYFCPYFCPQSKNILEMLSL